MFQIYDGHFQLSLNRLWWTNTQARTHTVKKWIKNLLVWNLFNYIFMVHIPVCHFHWYLNPRMFLFTFSNLSGVCVDISWEFAPIIFGWLHASGKKTRAFHLIASTTVIFLFVFSFLWAYTATETSTVVVAMAIAMAAKLCLLRCLFRS